MSRFSLRRLLAVMLKEFLQMRRDRATFAMIAGIPVMQLLLFGFAINSDPRHLPIALVDADGGPHARAVTQAMRTSGYFDFDTTSGAPVTERRAEELLRTGGVQFVLNIPPDFSRKLLRGERADLLLEADATDPAATGPALAAIQALLPGVISRENGLLAGGGTVATGADTGAGGGSGVVVGLIVHRHYNPENITQYNTVPGLLGVVLTMTMVIITALVITRERERGTMENLLVTPARPLEVLCGKIIPYIAVGYVQITLVLAPAATLFAVPVEGSIALIYAVAFVFIAANLCVGVTFSTLARNQLQAVQMAVLFFLPSLLLSGFMFPFRGMPRWAQVLGEALPLTHFLRVVRGVMLKGNGLAETLPEVWPIATFALIMLAVALTRYRRTLD